MKARSVRKLDPRRSLGENAARIVKVRLDELRSFAPEALDPGREREQHDMRIAAKRLRYVLEVTDDCFGAAGKAARRRARELQDILGEMHDCDVMLPRVESHLAELRSADAEAVAGRVEPGSDLEPRLVAGAPHRGSYGGLGVLAVYLEARRRMLFDRFTEFWREQERAGTWDRLKRTADRRLDEAKRRRRSAAATRRGAPARSAETPPG